MRTTVDLPPAVHRRARALARSRGQSLSTVIAELTALGLRQTTEPDEVETHPTTGFPLITLGVPTGTQDVSALWDEE
ncbi:MAG: hypothetical protein M3424_10370 [Actinomycetota bacterium]|nr:hypothetical protein [Actinomycetota bacterium]MDQ3528257.1 hypothetical protein [Actinomycetota bacterium]